jgi:hypothetical protein
MSWCFLIGSNRLDPEADASPSASATWGTTAAERALPFPCDRLIPAPDAALYRGVSVAAPAAVVYRWLCQLRVAPYSYDWIDNLGRQSPRRLTPGLDDLAVGQEVMRIFTLAGFERNRHLTIRTKPQITILQLVEDLAGTYLVVPAEGDTCRLLVKLVVRYPPGLAGRLAGWFLPWGDLVMMRRQLLNLKKLAERSARMEN